MYKYWAKSYNLFFFAVNNKLLDYVIRTIGKTGTVGCRKEHQDRK